MTSHFPALNYKDLVKIAHSHGFVFWRQAKGSHEVWKRPTDGRRTVIPNQGSKPLKRKTIKSILDDLEINQKELLRNS